MTLSCTDLSVRRGGRLVVSGVKLTLPRGQLHAVVGPNGAGKSSLLAAIAGELPADGGGVALGGRVLDQWPPRDLAQRRALLSQRPEVPFALAAWQLVQLGRLPHGATAAEDDAVVQACLQRLGLLALAERDVHTLSGGEAQRVHLARVLAQLTQPSGEISGWLLLDEPTAALDLGRADHTLAQLRSLCRAEQAGRSGEQLPSEHSSTAALGALVVLHDLGLALRHADTVTVLAGGGCVAHGPPAEVLRAPLIAEVWGVRVRAVRDDTGAVVALVPRAESPVVSYSNLDA